MDFGLAQRLAHCMRLFVMLLIAGMTASGFANESSDSVYVHSDSPMLDVQNALHEAKASDKLLLLVMGAQWCHDSRGLAEKFEDPDVAEVLAEHYQTLFVDVGYYKDLRFISQRFNQAHYFATPTVMIIDADTERLINAKDMHIWGSADSLPAAKYLDYFTAYASKPLPLFESVPEKHAAALTAFEQQNAQRLTLAYERLVPAMQLEDRTGEVRDNFLKEWREVRAYRTSLQKDIQSIREQAVDSPERPLIFPSYEPFSWDARP